MAAGRRPASRRRNTDAKRESYHHGDLRTALIVASAELMAERGPHDFTLREVARRAGVSHAAPYRHFAGRDDLVHAVAREGLDGIRLLVEQAEGESADPIGRLRARLAVYLDFARAQPAWYRVMFDDAGGGSEIHEAARQPLDLLVTDVGLCQRAGRFRPGNARGLATMLWATAHGAASLVAQGHLDAGEAVRILESAVDALRMR